MSEDASPYETLRVERADGIVTVTLTRPSKKNAMTTGCSGSCSPCSTTSPCGATTACSSSRARATASARAPI